MHVEYLLFDIRTDNPGKHPDLILPKLFKVLVWKQPNITNNMNQSLKMT